MAVGVYVICGGRVLVGVDDDAGVEVSVGSGVKVEELYREIRALRIYEGATEVQKLIIARQTMEAALGPG